MNKWITLAEAMDGGLSSFLKSDLLITLLWLLQFILDINCKIEYFFKCCSVKKIQILLSVG